MKLNKLFWCLGLLFAASTCMAQMYTVTDLGTMSPTSINLVGQVVGNFNGHAYLWTQSNGFHDLGTLVGGAFSKAAAINDLGMVTGTADGPGTMWEPPGESFNVDGPDCANLVQPFLWTPGEGMRGLGTPAFFNNEVSGHYCGIPYFATGINLSGQIIGYSWAGGSTYAYGFVWDGADGWRRVFGNWLDSSANGINNAGQIVGQNGYWYDPVSWKAGAVTTLPKLPRLGAVLLRMA